MLKPDAWTKSSGSTDLSSCVEARLDSMNAPVEWRKSSASLTDSTCVVAGVQTDVWKKSSASDASGPWCVEVAGAGNGDVLVRDSKLGEASPVLRFTREEWRAFIGEPGVSGAKGGEFDITG